MSEESVPAPLWFLIAVQAGISAASLVVEIVAGRMIAPYVGMSLYTWTAIIAVVLAGFSIGHWWGGRIGGRATGDALRLTGWTMVGAAVTTGGAAMLLRAVAEPVLSTLSHPFSAIMALTMMVFFLPSLFAGVPAPVLAIVAMRGRGRSEHALGAMFAAGAVGAILGTLLAGFLFISWLGTIATLTVITVVYAAAALAFFRLGRATKRSIMASSIGVLVGVGLGGGALGLLAICDRESQYYCIRTVTLSEDASNPVHLMVIDHLAHGVSAREAPRVMFTQHAAMLDALPRMRMEGREFSSFHIGGGSYSVPRAWTDRGINRQTVAEIDPAVTQQAVEDFWFVPETVQILHADARRALRENSDRYDVIIGDAFTDITVPAHLVTKEFFELVSDRLAPQGVFAMNVIDNADRLAALVALFVTLRTVFPSVEVWTEARPPKPAERRVFVLLASAANSPVSAIRTSGPERWRFSVLDDRFMEELADRTNARSLTDDYAPIDRLMGFDTVIE